MSKYSRPYCENCKLIWGVGAIGQIVHCTECGAPLIWKSFNPWPRVGGGIALISVGLVTTFLWLIPIVWIGAYIWGGSLIYNAWRQWSKINKIDLYK